MLNLLRHRNYRLLWLAQLVSGMGDVLYQVGVIVLIFERTGSALQTAVVTVAHTLPPFLLGPFAGALVDRLSRRNVLFSMNMLRAALIGLLLLAVRDDGFNLWLVYLIVGGLAAGTAVYQPARQALIPSLVPPRQLVAANSLMLGANQATHAAGYLLGGILITQVGFRPLIWLDLGAFIAGGLIIAAIRLTPQQAAREAPEMARPPLFRAIRDGFSYARHHPLARPLVVMEVLEHIPHGVWTSALMLVFVEQALGGTPEEWGFQNSAFFGGMIVGAIVAAMVTRQMARRPGWFIIANAFQLSLLTLVYAVSPTSAYAIGVSFLFGPPFALRDVAQDSLLQSSVDGRYLGRVYALRSMGLNVTFMLGGLFFAWLADIISIRQVYALAALLYGVTAVYALTRPALRRSRISQQPLTAGH